MDPFTWLAVFVFDDLFYVFAAISAISAAAGAAVSYQGSKNAAEAAEDNAKAQNKAAEMAARNTELEGAEAIKRERINKRRALARLRADHGTSGVVMDGSSMDVFAETAGGMELRIQDAARGNAMEASNQRRSGAVALWEGRQQAAATRISAYGTLLSDTAGIAGNAYKSGAFGTGTNTGTNTGTDTSNAPKAIPVR